MIQVTANSTMHQPHPDVSDDNDVDRSCIMHLVYTVLRPKMGVSLSEFDEKKTEEDEDEDQCSLTMHAYCIYVGKLYLPLI